MIIETLCIMTILISTTACQLSPQLAMPEDEMYGDRSKLYIHQRKPLSTQEYDIYIDKKKIDSKTLDKHGAELIYGAHAIDIVDKKTSKTVRHLDIYLNPSSEKHLEMCRRDFENPPELDDRDQPQGACIPNRPN